MPGSAKPIQNSQRKDDVLVSEINNNGNTAKSWRSALIATAALIAAFAAAAVPIPLYADYQMMLGLTDSDISMTTVYYLAGVVCVLFMGGSLSDALGRRPMVAAALISGAIGCALFAWLPSATVLQGARLVQGISCGLTMSATSAFVLDCTSHHHRTFGTTMASTGALIGLTVGSLGIGVFAIYSQCYAIVYVAFVAAMLVICALLPLTHETVTHRITVRHAVRPLVHVPKNLHGVFPMAAGCYIAAWGIGMFFQSLSTPAAVQYFGSTDPLLPAIILALAMAPSALGGPMSARTSTRFALGGGSVLMLATCAGLFFALNAGAMEVFLVLCFVFAVACGIILSASLHLLVSYSDPSESAIVISLINFGGYAGTTIISVLMSALAAVTTLANVFAFLAVIGACAMIPGAIMGLKSVRK